MISIFNGRERRLGKTSERIYAQFDVAFRRYVHLFKNARLHVFLEIALHSDEWGFSWPSAATICRNTGYGEDTVWYALRDLETLTLDGARVLQRYSARAAGNRVANNVYLIFPTEDELARYRDAAGRLVDEPSRGRVLRIALPPGMPCPPEFPYSDNPRSGIPRPELPMPDSPWSDEPGSVSPDTENPHSELRQSDDPATKQIDRRADPNGSKTTESETSEQGTTTTAEASALQAFAEANGRSPNPIERRGLARIAHRCSSACAAGPADGWIRIEAAIVEAVESGSTYVAVRRIEAVCERWLAEGVPRTSASESPAPRSDRSAVEGSVTEAETLPEVWHNILAELRPHVSRAAQTDWLGRLQLVARAGDVLIAEVGDAATADWIGGRYGPLVEKVASAVLGEPVRVEIRGPGAAGAAAPSGPDAER